MDQGDERHLVGSGKLERRYRPQAGEDVVISTASPLTVTYDSVAPSVSVNSLTVGADNFVVAGPTP